MWHGKQQAHLFDQYYWMTNSVFAMIFLKQRQMQSMHQTTLKSLATGLNRMSHWSPSIPWPMSITIILYLLLAWAMSIQALSCHISSAASSADVSDFLPISTASTKFPNSSWQRPNSWCSQALSSADAISGSFSVQLKVQTTMVYYHTATCGFNLAKSPLAIKAIYLKLAS